MSDKYSEKQTADGETNSSGRNLTDNVNPKVAACIPSVPTSRSTHTGTYLGPGPHPRSA